MRTWAPRGQTPVLEFAFNWKSLSAIAGLTLCNFYFRLYPGTIRSKQVIEFLQHLQRHLGRRLLIVWDCAGIHRSRCVVAFLDSLQGRIVVEYLPGYAPELNPVEYIWGYWKQHELPNFCPRELWTLSHRASQALRRMRHRPHLVDSFWKQAELF